MSSTRPSATTQAELEALVLQAARIDRRRAAMDLDAAFIDCLIAPRHSHPVAMAYARIRPALRTRLN